MSSDPHHNPPLEASDENGTGPALEREPARALPQLIEDHNRALHAFLMTRVRDEQEARDVAQEAYMQILQLNKPGAINFLRAYLFRTAANIAINRAKQRRTREELDRIQSADPPVDQLTPDRWVLVEQELKIFQRALLELSPKARRAFMLHRFREWSNDEIARDLGVQPRMVRHYLMQAGLYCKLRVRGFSPDEARKQVNR